MGNIFCLIGKSGAGKDTVFNELIKKNIPGLKPVVTYTTRPKRVNETEGKEYHFVDENTLHKLEAEGKVIERRTYHTVNGDWNYFTCSIDLSQSCDYIMIGTPDVVDKLYDYYDDDTVIIIYLELDEKERLLRCINREEMQSAPNYSEVCRRFLADEEDFYKGRFEKYKRLYRVDSSNSNCVNVSRCEEIINKCKG